MEKVMRKGEIACYKQFLLVSQCFYPIWHLFLILNALSIVVCNCFNLDQSTILSSGNRLTLSQTTNIRLFQTERVCRRQFQS